MRRGSGSRNSIEEKSKQSVVVFASRGLAVAAGMFRPNMQHADNGSFIEVHKYSSALEKSGTGNNSADL